MINTCTKKWGVSYAAPDGCGFAPVEKRKYDVTGLGEFVKEITGETNLLIDTAEEIRTSREVLTKLPAIVIIKKNPGVIDQMTPEFSRKERYEKEEGK